MPTRAKSINTNLFAAFCFTVLEESEIRDDILDDEELYELALRISKNDSLTAEAFLIRFQGFIEMSGRPEAKEFLSDHRERLMFHPALFEAAAQVRTRHNGSFPERPFFRKAKELASTKYTDFNFNT